MHPYLLSILLHLFIHSPISLHSLYSTPYFSTIFFSIHFSHSFFSIPFTPSLLLYVPFFGHYSLFLPLGFFTKTPLPLPGPTSLLVVLLPLSHDVWWLCVCASHFLKIICHTHIFTWLISLSTKRASSTPQWGIQRHGWGGGCLLFFTVMVSAHAAGWWYKSSPHSDGFPLYTLTFAEN